jgi:hypothetical protein
MSGKVDGMVVLVHLGMARRPLLKELGRVLAASPVRKLGVVVTAAGVATSYGYQYGSYARTPELDTLEPEEVAAFEEVAAEAAPTAPPDAEPASVAGTTATALIPTTSEQERGLRLRATQDNAD